MTMTMTRKTILLETLQATSLERVLKAIAQRKCEGTTLNSDLRIAHRIRKRAVSIKIIEPLSIVTIVRDKVFIKHLF